MNNYLQNRNGTYYFRRAVPLDIRSIFVTVTGEPRSEWAWSLGVKDREKAKRLLPQCVIQTDAVIDHARKAALQAHREVTANPTSQQLADTNELAQEMERASLESAEALGRMASEESCRAEEDPSFAAELNLRTMQASEASDIRIRLENRELLAELRAENAVSITGLFEKWASVEGRHPKTVRGWRPYIQKLVTHLGHDNALNVREADIVAWRNELRDGKGSQPRKLSAKTINGSYLGAVSALFAWAKDDGLIPTNPARDVPKVRAVRTPSLRKREFTLDEAKRILRASLKAHDLEGREGEELRNAKRWVPWLMAYSGARVNEITQLRKQDVTIEDGVMVMRLTPEAGTIKAKKTRVVPLHSHLVEMGFLDFVAGKADGPLFFDPSKRRSDDAINRQANRLGSKLAEWVRALGLKDAELKPNHAWRHLFNTLALRYEIEGRVARAILGHSAGNSNEDYGSVPVDVMAKQLERLPRFL